VRVSHCRFLTGATTLATLAGSAKADDATNVASSRMSYSRFLEYLDMGRVKKVDLYDNGTIAIVEAVSPELGNRVQRSFKSLGRSRSTLPPTRSRRTEDPCS
jgi:cell division protease FtsH